MCQCVCPVSLRAPRPLLPPWGVWALSVLFSASHLTYPAHSVHQKDAPPCTRIALSHSRAALVAHEVVRHGHGAKHVLRRRHAPTRGVISRRCPRCRATKAHSRIVRARCGEIPRHGGVPLACPPPEVARRECQHDTAHGATGKGPQEDYEGDIWSDNLLEVLQVLLNLLNLLLHVLNTIPCSLARARGRWVGGRVVYVVAGGVRDRRAGGRGYRRRRW